MIPSMLARLMMNLGNQVISLTFLERHQKTTQTTNWQNPMKDTIIVAPFMIFKMI